MQPSKLLLFGLVFFGSFGVSLTECNVPPEFWCDNIDIAKHCQVFEQCQRYWHGLNSEDAPLVQFTLYYESLCPDCQQFFAQSLKPAYEKLHNIMNLTLVPYGNARETKVGSRWKFSCQHGPYECQGNLIETCAIHYIKNITVYFPFLACMEASHKKPEEAATDCAKQNNIPIQSIINCSKSDEGNALEHEMALKTDGLEPSHTFVPWVTLNGVHTESIQEKAQTNLLKLICTTYKGPKPAACSSV